jgi:hypothetical protein
MGGKNNPITFRRMAAQSSGESKKDKIRQETYNRYFRTTGIQSNLIVLEVYIKRGGSSKIFCNFMADQPCATQMILDQFSDRINPGMP